MDLLSHFETHAQEELQRTLKRLGPVNSETREALEAMLHGLVRSFRMSHYVPEGSQVRDSFPQRGTDQAYVRTG